MNVGIVLKIAQIDKTYKVCNSSIMNNNMMSDNDNENAEFVSNFSALLDSMFGKSFVLGAPSKVNQKDEGDPSADDFGDFIPHDLRDLRDLHGFPDDSFNDEEADVVVYADLTARDFDMLMKSYPFNSVFYRHDYYKDWLAGEREWLASVEGRAEVDAEEKARQEMADWWNYVLEDTEYWHDRRHNPHLIADMETDYIRNTINWLKRRADKYAKLCISDEDRAVMDADHWLHSSNVMRALCDELMTR